MANLMIINKTIMILFLISLLGCSSRYLWYDFLPESDFPYCKPVVQRDLNGHIYCLKVIDNRDKNDQIGCSNFRLNRNSELEGNVGYDFFTNYCKAMLDYNNAQRDSTSRDTLRIYLNALSYSLEGNGNTKAHGLIEFRIFYKDLNKYYCSDMVNGDPDAPIISVTSKNSKEVLRKIVSGAARRTLEDLINDLSDYEEQQFKSTTITNIRFQMPTPGLFSISNINRNPYARFVDLVENYYVDSQYHAIKFDTTNHPPIDTLLKQLDKTSKTFPRSLTPDVAGGIGVYVKTAGNYLIVNPLKGEPADLSGILIYDTVVSINDKSTYQMCPDSAVNLLKGEIGSSVALTIKRNAGEVIFVILRKRIIEPTVRCCGIYPSAVGYVRILKFGEDTPNDVDRTIDSLIHLKVKKIIIDLRGNEGGYLYSATDVAELFLPKSTVIVTIKQNPKKRDSTYRSTNGKFNKIPLVVLTDSITAAGAEIVTAALKENNRAIVIGTKTYGNGRVHSPLIISDSLVLNLTSGYMLTPSGNRINNVGILPTIIAAVPKDSSSLKKQFFENENPDIVIEKAIDFLNNMDHR